jgi:hypothetical protein
MANPVINNNDTEKLVIRDARYRQEVVKFTAAQTYLEGAILARKLLSDTVSVAADGGNTGDGTVTAAALASGGPALVGAYNLECTAAVTNGGVFKLEDPNGIELENAITIPAGAGNSIVFVGHGLTFTLTDGATDFIVGDKFSLTTTEDGVLEAYAADGVDGTEIPMSLMPRARTEASGANYPQSVLVEGEVVQSIVETAQGGALSKALIDKLLDASIVVQTGVQLLEQDNQ